MCALHRDLSKAKFMQIRQWNIYKYLSQVWSAWSQMYCSTSLPAEHTILYHPFFADLGEFHIYNLYLYIDLSEFKKSLQIHQVSN